MLAASEAVFLAAHAERAHSAAHLAAFPARLAASPAHLAASPAPAPAATAAHAFLSVLACGQPGDDPLEVGES